MIVLWLKNDVIQYVIVYAMLRQMNERVTWNRGAEMEQIPLC